MTDIDVALAAAAGGAAAAKQRYGADLTYLPKSATDFRTEADLAPADAGFSAWRACAAGWPVLPAPPG